MGFAFWRKRRQRSLREALFAITELQEPTAHQEAAASAEQEELQEPYPEAASAELERERLEQTRQTPLVGQAGQAEQAG